MRLEQAVDRSLRHKVLSLVGESPRQLARRQLRLLQSQIDDLAPDLFGDAVPDAPRPGRTVAQSLRPAGSVKIVPAVERGRWNAELLQRPANRQVGLLDQADDLGLFGCGVSSLDIVVIFIAIGAFASWHLGKAKSCLVRPHNPECVMFPRVAEGRPRGSQCGTLKGPPHRGSQL